MDGAFLPQTVAGARRRWRLRFLRREERRGVRNTEVWLGWLKAKSLKLVSSSPSGLWRVPEGPVLGWLGLVGFVETQGAAARVGQPIRVIVVPDQAVAPHFHFACPGEGDDFVGLTKIETVGVAADDPPFHGVLGLDHVEFADRGGGGGGLGERRWPHGGAD